LEQCKNYHYYHYISAKQSKENDTNISKRLADRRANSEQYISKTKEMKLCHLVVTDLQLLSISLQTIEKVT